MLEELTPDEVDELEARVEDWDMALFLESWEIWKSEKQTVPDQDFLVWLILGGRGAGKTRAGAEWVRAQVKSGHRHIALVAATYTEADGLRGSQFDAAWADEFCAWNHAEETLSNLRLALRLTPVGGGAPQLVVTTTPRPSAELIELKAAEGVVTHTLRTADNAHHLAPGFMASIEALYGGSPRGMQELEGQIVTDWPGALWSLSTIAQTRENTAPDLGQIPRPRRRARLGD